MSQQAAHSHEDKLLDFAYGELPEAEARTVEAHLAGCARCAGSLESIRGVRKTMSMLESDEAPDVGLDSLMAYAQQTARRVQAGPASRSSPWRKWMFGMAAAASLGVVGIVGTEVAKEVSPQAVIQEKARVQGMAAEQTAYDAQPQPVPAPAGAAAGAASNELAERATRVTPKIPSLGGSVASRKEEKAKQGGELDVGRLGDLARRDAVRGGVVGGLNDDQDVAQARNLGIGMGTGGDKLSPAKPSPAPEQTPPPPPPQRAPSKSDTTNYYDPRTAAVSKDSEQKAVAPSRLSMGGKGSGSGPAPAAPAADLPQDSDRKMAAVAEDDSEEESSVYDEGALTSAPAEPRPQPVVTEQSASSAAAAAPAPPMAPPSTTQSSPAPSRKKTASLGTDEYERLAAQARRSGALKEEIRYLWAAVERTSPGGRQIGLLSRLCELEISAEMYQPQSCHRLVTEYPRHNAGLLAKKRLEAQAQQMQRK